MKTKEEIVQDWLPRYTGKQLENFGKYKTLLHLPPYGRCQQKLGFDNQMNNGQFYYEQK